MAIDIEPEQLATCSAMRGGYNYSHRSAIHHDAVQVVCGVPHKLPSTIKSVPIQGRGFAEMCGQI